MYCRNCEQWNEDNANFCSHCGSELHKETVVSAPIVPPVTAYSIPTSGVRYFQGIGNYALQNAVQIIRDSEKPAGSAYKGCKNHAKVQPLRNGDWFCPDCGEFNSHNEFSCRGCGRYK